MAITASDIKYYESTGSLGGARTTTEVVTTVNGLFDLITAPEGTAGMTDYRCIYIRNENATSNALISATVALTTQATDTNTTISIGLDPAGIDGTATTIANENTVPTGVTFSSANTPMNLPADLGVSEEIAVWFRRVVVAGSSATNDSTEITVAGETTQ